ncbi:MAG: WD40 repeat domain-containing protein [Bacteroidales bacterium]
MKPIVSIFLVFFLSIGAQAQDMPSYSGHNDHVVALAYSPDGNYFASGSKDETFILWDAKTGKQIFTKSEHHQPVYALTFTHDSKFLLSAGDQHIFMWAVNGNFEKRMEGHNTLIWSLELNHNDTRLVSGSFDRTFRLWNVVKGEELHVFDKFRKSVLATAYHPSKPIIASGSQEQSVYLWDAETFEEILKIEGHADNIYALDFHPDGSLLASVSRDKMVKVWDVETGKLEHLFSGHERSVMDVKFSHDGNFLISGSYDTHVSLWDLHSGMLIHTFEGAGMPIEAIALSPDDRYLLIGGADNDFYRLEITPEIIAGFYFQDEIVDALWESNLQGPRRKGESRREYKERSEKVEALKKELYNRYYEKYKAGDLPE